MLHWISGWLSKNCDQNSRMRALWAGILNGKFCACVNSHRNFWTTNLKSSVPARTMSMCNYDVICLWARIIVHAELCIRNPGHDGTVGVLYHQIFLVWSLPPISGGLGTMNTRILAESKESRKVSTGLFNLSEARFMKSFKALIWCALY